MTRDELTDRVTELFPPLAEVEPWQWAETEEGEPVVVVERYASFTGLDGGDVDLTAPIPEHVEDRRLADRHEQPLQARGVGRRSAREGGRAGSAQLMRAGAGTGELCSSVSR